MTANAFTKRWLIALSSPVLLGIAFPFIIGPLAHATGCQGVGGACGAVALMLGVFLRLPVVIGVGLYVAILAWKRSAVLHLKPYGFHFIVISYLAASGFLFGFDNFWAANFSLGISTAESLPAFGFLLAGLSGLSLLPDDVTNQKGNIARLITLVVGALSIILLLPEALKTLLIIPFLNMILFPGILALLRLVAPFLRYVGSFAALFALLAFVISLGWWIKSSKTDRTGIA